MQKYLQSGVVVNGAERGCGSRVRLSAQREISKQILRKVGAASAGGQDVRRSAR